MTKSDKAELEERAWRACKGALNYLWQSHTSWCFREPVDEEKHRAPGYYAAITDPQDLLTIRNRLESNKFKAPSEVDAAVRQMCQNAFTYNAVDHDVHKSAKNVLALWTEQWESRGVAALWSAARDPASRAALIPPCGRRGGSGSGPLPPVQQLQEQQPKQQQQQPQPPPQQPQQQQPKPPPQPHHQQQLPPQQQQPQQLPAQSQHPQPPQLPPPQRQQTQPPQQQQSQLQQPQQLAQPRLQQQQQQQRPPQQPQPRQRPQPPQQRPQPQQAVPSQQQRAPGPRGSRKRRPAIVYHPPMTPDRILQMATKDTADHSPVPLLLSLLRAATWLPQLFLSCGRLKAQMLGGRTSDPELVLVRCLCAECASQSLPGYMPLTHFYMHARGVEGDAAGLDEQTTPCQSDAEGEGNGWPTSGGGGGGSVGGEEEAAGGRARVRVADMESLKMRVWGALRCGGSAARADECPYLDTMRQRAEEAGGRALVGRRVWVYHFSEFLANSQYGTWRPGVVTSYAPESAEHELRYDTEPQGPLENVQLGVNFLHFGATAPFQGSQPLGPRGQQRHVPNISLFFAASAEGAGTSTAARGPPPPTAGPPRTFLQGQPLAAGAAPRPQLRNAIDAAVAAAAAAATMGPMASSVHLLSVSNNRGNPNAPTTTPPPSAASAAGAACEAIVIDDDDDDEHGRGAAAPPAGAPPFSQRQALLAGHAAPQQPQQQQSPQQQSLQLLQLLHKQRQERQQRQVYQQAAGSCSQSHGQVATQPPQPQQPQQPQQLQHPPPPVALRGQPSYPNSTVTSPTPRAPGVAAGVATALNAAAAVAAGAGGPSSDGTKWVIDFMRGIQPYLPDAKANNDLEFKVRNAALQRLMTPEQRARYDLGGDHKKTLMAEIIMAIHSDQELEAKALAIAVELKRQYVAQYHHKLKLKQQLHEQQQQQQQQQQRQQQQQLAGQQQQPQPQQPQQQPQQQPRQQSLNQPQGQQQQQVTISAADARLLQHQHQHQQQQLQAAAAAAVHQQQQLHQHQILVRQYQMQMQQHHHQQQEQQRHQHALMQASGYASTAAMAAGMVGLGPQAYAQHPPIQLPYNVVASRAQPPGPTTGASTTHAQQPPPGSTMHPFGQVPPAATAVVTYPPGAAPAGSQAVYPHPMAPRPQQGAPSPAAAPVPMQSIVPPAVAAQGEAPEQQALKRQRLDSGASAAILPSLGSAPISMAPSQGLMAPGPPPHEPPALAQRPSLDQQAAGRHASPPPLVMMAAAASSGGLGSVSAGAGDECAVVGGGGGVAAGAVLGGSCAAAPAGACGAPEAAGSGSRFRTMSSQLTDVVEMTRALIDLMEQVPLSPEEARGVRKALRQLQASGKGEYIQMTYVMLCSVAKDGDEEEMRDMFQELRTEAARCQQQNAAAKPEAG